MQLAHGMRVEAVLSEDPRQGGQVFVQRPAVGRHAVIAGIQTGQQRPAAWAANLIRSVVACEASPLRGESVEIGGLRLRIPTGAKTIGALLVRAEHDQIRSDLHFLAPCRFKWLPSVDRAITLQLCAVESPA